MEAINPQAKAGELIEKLNDFHSNILNKNTSGPEEIEIDLMLGYLRELYEQILLLKKKQVEHKPAIAKPKEEIAEEKKPIIITRQEQPIPPKPEPKENLPAKNITPKKELEAEIPRVMQQKEEQQQKTSSSVKAEMLHRTPPNPSLNEKFKKNDSGIGEKLGLKSVADLKSAIGVNQRFSFINELFSRNAPEYDRAIKHLNNCQSHEEAAQFIRQLKSKYRWEEKSSAAKEFMDLMKRRFL